MTLLYLYYNILIGFIKYRISFEVMYFYLWNNGRYRPENHLKEIFKILYKYNFYEKSIRNSIYKYIFPTIHVPRFSISTITFL